jgi:hypothetical protein
MLEAEAQLGKGLNLLASLPEDAERQQRELDLLSTLIVTVMQTQGYAAPAVAETLARAPALRATQPAAPVRERALRPNWVSHPSG